MPASLSEPPTRFAPVRVTPDTWLVREVQHALGPPLSVYINSAVVLAAEPVLVDTGSLRNRRAWLEDTFSIVEPGDVRWVFLSHEDPDHAGNVAEVMEACTNATLVCSWALTERFHNAYDFPLARCRWLGDGDRFDAGDRQMAVVRPVVYDGPTTRGLLDTATKVFWASDDYATPMPGGVGATSVAEDVAELDREFWHEGMEEFALNALAPWLTLVDPERFASTVERLRALGIETIISGHCPVIRGEKVLEAWGCQKALAGREAPPVPDQAALDLFLAAIGHERLGH
ncbi:MAG TPA: MBL fold metallo-hydrolase [Acidimicrobiales bacterium]|nr:MBL fold metallo-hydrolase [Acidimicrobiales bacterium]